MSAKVSEVVHYSLKDFERGKYFQCLNSLENIQFSHFNPLEWVRDNNLAICRSVLKEYTEPDSLGEEELFTSVFNTWKQLKTVLTKIRSFNSTENDFGLITECVVLYNLVLLYSSNCLELNSTGKLIKDNFDLNSSIELTVKRILAFTNYSTHNNSNYGDIETLTNASKNSSIIINHPLLSYLKPLLYLYTCICSPSSSNRNSQLEELVGNILAENSRIISKWEIQFALPASLGSSTHIKNGTIAQNMTVMFQILDIALKTNSFPYEIFSQMKYTPWIPYLNYVQSYCLYRKYEYQKAIDILNDKKDEHFTNDFLQSLVLNLEGCCLFKLGNYWSGIQKFQSALVRDFSFILPLWNVVVVYHCQKKQNAELDSLEYLVKCLELKEKKGIECVEFRQNKLEKVSKPSFHSFLSLPHVLYMHGHRCLQLGHISKAADKFLDLLTFLTETPILQPDSKSVVPLPGIAEIYLEAAFCMLSDERYIECIAICDWLLSSHCISNLNSSRSSQSFKNFSALEKNNSDEEDEEFLFGDSETSKKRSYSEVSPTKSIPSKCDSLPQPATNEILVSALLYKADAYFYQDEIENVFNCLQRATDIVKNEGLNSTSTFTQLQPLSKRQKVSSDYDQSIASESSCSSDLISAKDHQNFLICSVYNNTGVFLCCRRQFKEALHCFRLGLQILNNDPSLNFNCALTLVQLEEIKDAVMLWTKYRNIDLNVDTVQLRKKLYETQKKLEMLQNDSKTEENSTPKPNKTTGLPSSITLLKFDIYILRTLLNSK